MKRLTPNCRYLIGSRSPPASVGTYLSGLVRPRQGTRTCCSIIGAKMMHPLQYVHAARRSVIQPTRNSRDELWKTLARLPPRLGGRDSLYVRMIQTINREYLPESNRLFHLVLEWEAYGYGPRHLDVISHETPVTDFYEIHITSR